MTPAEAPEIIDVMFERMRDGTGWSTNWGTAMDNSIWHVGPYTYINGIMLHVDFDFEGMWLLEVCDRDVSVVKDPTPVRWLAVATGHWPDDQAIKFEWFTAPCPQFFFERTVNSWDVMGWAMAWYKDIDLDGHGG